jgi:tetratricopeptide (TPR) repeat protein
LNNPEAVLLESLVGATAASVLGTVGGVAGAVSGIGPVKAWLNGCRTRALAGRFEPGNHELVRGVRTAHLCAFDHVARRYTSVLADLPAHEIGPDDHAFAINLRAFIAQRLRPLSEESIDHDALTADDINHVLEQLVHAASHESYAELSHKARLDCEARALDEIARDAGRKAPPLFERVFKGDSGGAGWYEAFSLFVTQQLKTNERFRSIFFATELVEIRRAVSVIDELLSQKLKDFPELSGFMSDVQRRLERIEQGVGQANTKLDQQTELLEKLAAHLGMHEGGAVLDAKVSQLEAVLTEWETPVEWAATQNNLGNALGRLGVREGGARGLASLEEAVSAYRAALTVRTEKDMPAAWAMTQNNLGSALQALGRRESGAQGLASLRKAVAAYRAALTVQTERDMPAEWASTQDNLGGALLTLGEREGGAKGLKILKRSLSAFGAALKVHTERDMPADWSGTQNNLGIALLKLGEREGGAGGLARIRDAVDACRAALTVRTEQDMPANWAATQTNLGNALQSLGRREGGTQGLANLAKASAAYRAALTIHTEKDMPALWAITLANQGVTMCVIAERTSDSELAKEALGQIETALEIFRQARHPRAKFYDGEAEKARALVVILAGRGLTDSSPIE